ncbi:hypothetical protein HDE68_002122 [Pedobacter cryoconitis]|uniref:Uncharacterized protein n=1 Tax=Pedobacter cryoconitis TaxID=188932 RepID=A0A7W9DZG9_9SPHI|nr:hypothetical protein [Pedobacter cryoconitis]
MSFKRTVMYKKDTISYLSGMIADILNSYPLISKTTQAKNTKFKLTN